MCVGKTCPSRMGSSGCAKRDVVAEGRPRRRRKYGVHLQFKAVRLSYNPLIPTPATRRRCSPLLASLFAVTMRLNCFFRFSFFFFSLLNERTMRPESTEHLASLPSVYRLSFRLHRRNFHIVLMANAHMRAREH